MIQEYVMTNKETGEKTIVALHTAGEGFQLFAPVEFLQGTPEEWTGLAEDKMTRFENPNMDGNLTNDLFEIAPMQDAVEDTAQMASESEEGSGDAENVNEEVE